MTKTPVLSSFSQCGSSKTLSEPLLLTSGKIQTSGPIERSKLRIRWLVLFLAALLLTCNYYCYDNPSALYAPLARQFETLAGFDQWFAAMYSVYSMPNLIIPLVGGMLVDHAGLYRSLKLFAILLLLGQSLLAFGASISAISVMIAGRFIFGLGGEAITVAQTALIERWFCNSGELALAMGLSLSISRLGSVLNNVVSPHVAIVTLSPAAAMWVGAALCVVCVCCCLALECLDRAATERIRNDTTLELAPSPPFARFNAAASNGTTTATSQPGQRGADGKKTQLLASVSAFGSPRPPPRSPIVLPSSPLAAKPSSAHRASSSQQVTTAGLEGGVAFGVGAESGGGNGGATTTTTPLYAAVPPPQSRVPLSLPLSAGTGARADASTNPPAASSSTPSLGTKMAAVQHALRDAVQATRSFSRAFWLLALCCVVVYGCVLPFNNIASVLLLYRDFFPLGSTWPVMTHFGSARGSGGGGSGGSGGITSTSNVTTFVYDSDHPHPPGVDCATVHGAATPFCSSLADAIGQASLVMSVPYVMSACLTPLLGTLVDRHGRRADLVLLSSLTLLLTHLLLSLTALPAALLLVGIGIGYSVFASVIWPAIPSIVERRQLGTAYGLITVLQNMGLVVLPILVGVVLNFWRSTVSSPVDPNPYEGVTLFFALLALCGVLCSLVLNSDPLTYRALNTAGGTLPSAAPSPVMPAPPGRA